MPTSATKTPIYESYSMLHPDGTVMCYCNFKKAVWYVSRELAVWVNEKTFKLKFVPQGYGKSDNPFYMQNLENRCVVCGTYENLNKHHVIPYVFRSRLPVQYKAKNHHDIVPICIDCHEAYEYEATKLKAVLAHQCGFTMNSRVSSEQLHNKKVLSARKMIERIDSGELTDSKGKIVILPEEKIALLRLKASEPLKEAPEINGTLWADKIMENVLKEDKLFEFVQSWRVHFIEHMKPQYLSEHWSIDQPLELARI